MKYLVITVLSSLIVGCNQSTPSTASAPSKVEKTPDAVVATDRTNTGINARDRDRETKTPIDQNETTADVKITADIRKQVVDTKMSINAQNVKIITQDGKVTLRGPVKTADEKARIEEIAFRVAGKTNVDNQIEVE